MSKPQFARTVDLCELLNVSDATVRRDLEWLEQKGFLERLYGGMILNYHMTFKLDIYSVRKKTDR